MIETPKRKKPQTTKLYHNGDHITTIDYTQFLKIRTQIKKLKLTGYTITYNKKPHPIHSNCKIELPK